MAKVASRPRNDLWRVRAARNLALIGAFLLPLLLTAGCNTGSRNEAGPPGPQLDPAQPLVTGINPEGGAPGDLITVSGKNFSPNLDENHVYFTNNNGSISIPGRIESVNVGVFVEGEGADSSLTVRIPTGVRTGFLNVEIDNVLNPNTGLTQDGVPAGARGFTGAPVVLGYAINDSGLGFAILQPFGALQPNTVTLLGYNLINNVTDVFIADDQSSSIPAAGITNGIPFSAAYTLPTGMEGVTVELPNGLIVNNSCNSQALELTVVSSSLGLSGSAVPFQIPLGRPGSFAGIEPYVTSASIPAGIRAGIIDMAFTYASDPSETLWDATFEFRDPTDPTGNTWLPLTQDPNQISPSTARLMPGNSSQVSDVEGVVGPGTTYTLHWDSSADIPPSLGLVTTQIRILFDEASGGTSLFTPSCVPDYVSPVIVVNNDVGATFSIVEDFNSNNQQGPGTNALWNSANSPGVLTAAPPPVGAPIIPATGAGTDDIILLAGGVYVIDTDSMFILDETDPVNPVDLLQNNPGATAGEFHVRSLLIQEGADVTWQGSNPVLFRVAGDGTDEFQSVVIAGEINFDGEAAVDATSGSNTPGGAGGICGGGAGGDGAFVSIDGANLLVDSIDPAGRGGLEGGYGGLSSTYVTGTGGSSSPRAGCGGGGGHAEHGDDAINALYEDPSSNAICLPPSPGGPARGDKWLTTLTAGAGGGGGGAVAVFANNNISARHGGGGGGGGGAFGVAARGSIQILGTISCAGGDGAKGSPGQQSGAGGGGAGGAIMLHATGNVEFGADALLNVAGGFGGIASSSSLNPVNGGDGSPGRISVQGNLAQAGINEGTYDPAEGTIGVSIGVMSVGADLPGISFTDLDSSVLTAAGQVAVTDPSSPNLGMVEYVVDTDLGEVYDSNGVLVFTNPALSTGGDSWVFELRNLEVPFGIALVGRGSMPLVFECSGFTTISGTIDVSGEAGGEPDFSDPLNPLPGLGGAPGAGGGAGGEGGAVDPAALTSTGGAAGGLSAVIPDSLIAMTPPLGGGGGTGNPVPSDGIVAAQGGYGSTDADPCDGSSGGGGGFSSAGTDAGASGGCEPGGMGGTSYGSNFFLVIDPENPAEAIELRAGGGGGAGGGAYASGSVLSPGSGGGGGGGFVEVFSRGPISVNSTAVLRARGGNAVRGPSNAGSGGAGAGGAIRMRSTSTVNILPLAVIDTQGGLANLEPVSTYPLGPTAQFTAGDGADGRVRMETPLGFTDGSGQNVGAFLTGAFSTADLRERTAVSTAYRLIAEDGSTLIGGASFATGAQSVVDLSTAGAGTEYRVLIEGAYADPASPAVPGEWFGPLDDTDLLDAVEFIRLRVLLYTTATDAPVIDQIQIDFNN
ncbi:MAG: hypothetical protein ACO4BJ_03880 [Planctomycetota bacterium]